MELEMQRQLVGAHRKRNILAILHARCGEGSSWLRSRDGVVDSEFVSPVGFFSLGVGIVTIYNQASKMLFHALQHCHIKYYDVPSQV